MTADAVVASLLAGSACGALDAFLALEASPDPGSTSYVIGLICGPVLLNVAWAVMVGPAVATLRSRGPWRPPAATRWSAGAVALVWLASVASDTVGSERSWPEILLVLAAASSAAASIAMLASIGADALRATSARWRRAGWATIAIGLGTTALLALPSGDLAFRPDDPACPTRSTAPAGRPNVLLVSIDTLRADAAREMRSYRRLAAAGIEFTSYVVPAPWTLPSVASLLTGLPPEDHGAGESRSSRSVITKTPVRSGVAGLAERLRAAGYRTQAIVTNPFLTPAYGIDRGFCGFQNLSMRTEAVRGLGTTSLVRLARRIAPGITPSDRADTVRDAVQEWLATPPAEPFFLWVHFLDPHAPYGDRPGASTSLTLDLRTFHTRRGFEEPFRAIAVLRSGEYRPTGDERRRIIDLYRADVAFVDDQLDRLLDFLAVRGLLESTVVVLTSDHGEELWDHGRVEHGHSLHEEIVNVPLVLSLPGGSPSGSDDRLATAIDVAPTIAALAGLDDPAWAGRDLLAPSSEERSVVLGHLLFGEEWSGVRTSTRKYMRSAHGSERVFDLVTDPGELHDRAAAEPAQLAALRAIAPGPADQEPSGVGRTAGRVERAGDAIARPAAALWPVP